MCNVLCQKDPLDVIAKWYDKITFMKAYEMAMEPMRRYKFWRCDQNAPIQQPNVKRKLGRLKKTRSKSQFKTKKLPKAGKLLKKGASMTCSKCKEIGHNKRSYKNQGEASHALEPEGTLASLACQSQSVHQVPIAEAQCESGNDNGNKRKNPSHKGSINSEVIIDHGSGNTEHHGDGWSFRYALTERRKLQTRKAATSTDSADLRKIKFAQEGAGPRNLGYTVQSDLQWNENLAITTRQLDETRQQMIGTLSKKAINSGACSSSKFARA
ncbi:uncharacterized protein LOC8281650 [Ricinus communis]|uniref:uncharacterized protein LOC8281650 n=1 Tax=Ricinus communis TaxID=3988 RepID=UPI000772185B|nr:uncharacterized protein LOC8281650 [Ricinus communis]XP_048226893.1 uncharacterized protein LOC8281650 [Ricinus communis]|eukprot:XP_015571481.1 uncharacterized protein LOC8281650 [Ricinus communis]